MLLDASCALPVAVFQYHVNFDEEKPPAVEVMPTWILPAYLSVVLGPIADVLLYSQPQTSSILILISGIMFQGLPVLFR